MTMDIYQRTIRADASPPIIVDSFHDRQSSSPTLQQQTATLPALKKCQKPAKRSFDVAFLMAPDDLSKKRQHEKYVEVKRAYKFSPSSEHESDAIIRNFASAGVAASAFDSVQQHYQLNPLSLTVHPDKLRDASRSPPDFEPKENPFFVRSAFTKVNNSGGLQLDAISRTPPVAASPSSVSSTTSNRSGLSPDLTYQDSLSPQPSFILTRSPVHLLPNNATKPYQPSQPPTTTANLQYFVTGPALLKEVKSEDRFKYTTQDLPPFESENTRKNRRYAASHPSQQPQPPTSNSKQNFAYHAENMAAAAAAAASIPYSGFPMGTFPFTPTLTPVTASTSVPMFPAAAAAANLTAALLPSSLAALTLPAQNVCAKCNMHFRMTSDLVYHMRSHHKNENAVVDPYKRRREQDKLKCPVCNESFRERHHLTRHMTAHQDKADEGASKEFVDITLQGTSISGSATK